jgi:hypothetical protein
LPVGGALEALERIEVQRPGAQLLGSQERAGLAHAVRRRT